MDPLEQKFTKMVNEQKSTIYTVCYMFSKDSDEVGDLFQEILVNLWKGFPSFEGRSDIRTWVYRVSMNIDLYEDNDADTKQVKLLYERINRLGVFDRAIVLLWLEGLPYDEIGDIVGISAKNVSVKLVRIREQLKKK